MKGVDEILSGGAKGRNIGAIAEFPAPIGIDVCDARGSGAPIAEEVHFRKKM